MSRYIDTDVAIDKVDCLFRDTERDKGNFMLRGYNHAVADCIAILKNLDVVELVRCKDCKYYAIYELKHDGTDDMRYKPSVCIKGKYSVHREPDWFCANGEVKE